MPVGNALAWAEVRDFSPGLWTKEKTLMPPNASQQMLDCYPVQTGGLRAWFQSTSFTTSGIGNTTTEQPRAIFAHDNITGSSATANDYYLITYSTADTQCRVYRLNKSNGDTAWSVLKIHHAGLDPGFISTTAYTNFNGDLYFVYGLGLAGGGTAFDGGVWSIRQSDAQITQRWVSGGYVANYQSRLVTSLGSVLHYTDPGVWTNLATNVAPVDVGTGQPTIMFFQPFSPGDLLVFKEGAAAYLVEGDLFNYTVQQMNQAHPVRLPGPAICVGPNGVIFRSAFDGIYETTDGTQMNPLSRALSAEEWNSNEPLAWLNHLLLSGENGKILDYDTHAWFQTSDFSAGSNCIFVLQRTSNFIFTSNTAGFTIGIVEPIDGDTGNRVPSYTWQSAPIRDPSGRQIEIREVQVYAQSFNGATSTITVTVNGDARTQACTAVSKAPLQFYFVQRDVELDVTITSASNSAGVEAPLIDTVRIGSKGGHFLVPGTV